jgi:hypothetical protein
MLMACSEHAWRMRQAAASMLTAATASSRSRYHEVWVQRPARGNAAAGRNIIDGRLRHGGPGRGAIVRWQERIGIGRPRNKTRKLSLMSGVWNRLSGYQRASTWGRFASGHGLRCSKA